MARKGYSTVFDAEKTAAARGVDVHTSPKASRNILRAIKGMRLEEAKAYLDEVTEKKRAVPMRVRHRKIKHRRGRVGPGAFPVKAAGRILRILANAQNNAEYKDLETENLRIVHASAYRGETIVKYKPRAQGRATARFEQTTNMEIVLGEDEAMDEREEAREERREQGGKRPARARKAKTGRRSVTEGKKEEKPEEAEAAEPTPKTSGSPSAKKGSGERDDQTGSAPAEGEADQGEKSKEEA